MCRVVYAGLLIAGFRTLTVKSSDKANAKIEAIAAFSDLLSDAQVFVANINIMSTGVNLHGACSKGIVANLHYNTKTM